MGFNRWRKCNSAAPVRTTGVLSARSVLCRLVFLLLTSSLFPSYFTEIQSFRPFHNGVPEPSNMIFTIMRYPRSSESLSCASTSSLLPTTDSKQVNPGCTSYPKWCGYHSVLSVVIPNHVFAHTTYAQKRVLSSMKVSIE